MNTQDWFKGLLTSLKDTFNFRLETLILNITEKICENMKIKNISRTDLAQRLKVSSPAVTKILNGNSNFTLKTLLSLTDALDLELVVDLKERSKHGTIQECSYTSASIYHSAESHPANYVATIKPAFGISLPTQAHCVTMAAVDTEETQKAKVTQLPIAA